MHVGNKLHLLLQSCSLGSLHRATCQGCAVLKRKEIRYYDDILDAAYIEYNQLSIPLACVLSHECSSLDMCICAEFHKLNLGVKFIHCLDKGLKTQTNLQVSQPKHFVLIWANPNNLKIFYKCYPVINIQDCKQCTKINSDAQAIAFPWHSNIFMTTVCPFKSSLEKLISMSQSIAPVLWLSTVMTWDWRKLAVTHMTWLKYCKQYCMPFLKLSSPYHFL